MERGLDAWRDGGKQEIARLTSSVTAAACYCSNMMLVYCGTDRKKTRSQTAIWSFYLKL